MWVKSKVNSEGVTYDLSVKLSSKLVKGGDEIDRFSIRRVNMWKLFLSTHSQKTAWGMTGLKMFKGFEIED